MIFAGSIVLVGDAVLVELIEVDAVLFASIVLVEDVELLVEADVLFSPIALAVLFAASLAFAMLWFDAVWFNMLAISSLMLALSALISDALSACVALSSVVFDWFVMIVVLNAASWACM
jgi:hypothetical protein